MTAFGYFLWDSPFVFNVLFALLVRASVIFRRPWVYLFSQTKGRVKLILEFILQDFEHTKQMKAPKNAWWVLTAGRWHALLLKMHASYPWNLWRTKRFVLYAWNFWNPKLHTVWISLLQSSHKNNHELPVFSINLGSELKLRLRWNQIINQNPTKCTNIQRISNSARELLLLKCLPFCN